jgi:dipeptidyl aminopeptidase/acylaminoacyl peptidase
MVQCVTYETQSLPSLFYWGLCRAPDSTDCSRRRRAMSLEILKVATGVLVGTSLLTLVGSVVGELVATLPPPFPSESANLPAELGYPYEEVAFPTTDGLTLRGWFIPAGPPDGPAILYAPATARDQRSGLSLVPAFHEAGYHVLLFSYRGHALSDGNRVGFTYGDAESRDVDAAVHFLHEVKGVRRVGVIGHSVGAASAILSAAHNPQIGAVVAVAPFNCVAELWHTSRPALMPPFVMDLTLELVGRRKGFATDEVCPLTVVHQIAPRPLLVIHGKDDRRITETQVRRLFAAAQAPKTLWLVDGASHGSIRTPVLDELAPDVTAFFDAALRDQAEQEAGPAHSLSYLDAD